MKTAEAWPELNGAREAGSRARFDRFRFRELHQAERKRDSSLRRKIDRLGQVCASGQKYTAAILLHQRWTWMVESSLGNPFCRWEVPRFRSWSDRPVYRRSLRTISFRRHSAIAIDDAETSESLPRM